MSEIDHLFFQKLFLNEESSQSSFLFETFQFVVSSCVVLNLRLVGCNSNKLKCIKQKRALENRQYSSHMITKAAQARGAV